MKTKRCFSCASAKPKTGKVPANVERCPMCGGRAFFYGQRMSHRLWPTLVDSGPDTFDAESGTEIPGVWDREVSQYTDVRWRR